ncbi:hypothetical protein [Leisingera caerulea]|uniref:hypothetical protein n=1 Tax=Leisingera caerulea TaxID=506591 RepID=UPI0021A7AC59|nr:hypothetical protein [Leisingera caerulea]UWQ83534.1 hypothetical protein K3726_18040 [Leisingera caerulea]
MPIVSDPAEGVPADVVFGLGIAEVQADQRHCGIIYRPSEEEVRFLHLAFHYKLMDEKLNDANCCADSGLALWCAGSGLAPESQNVLAALACNIAEAKPGIPYAFDMDGNVFDPDTGRLKPGPPGTGLTCASFVLAVMNTYGFRPIDFSNWPERAEDEPWQEKILELMTKTGASEDHLKAVRGTGLNTRFRPEEVVGAAAQDEKDWAFDQSKAVELAKEVLEDMGGS